MKEFFSHYIFILIPFIVLVLTKGIVSNFEGVLSSTDWSIGSFMIIAQCMSYTLSHSYNHPRLSLQGLSIFFGLTLILLILCAGFYVFSIIYPENTLANLQPVMFIVSSIWMAGIFKAKEYLDKIR